MSPSCPGPGPPPLTAPWRGAVTFRRPGREHGGVSVPIVRVEIARGVASVEQKKAVIRRMTDVLVEELGRDPDYVFVVIDEIDTDNWGRKGRSLTELWRERDAGPG